MMFQFHWIRAKTPRATALKNPFFLKSVVFYHGFLLKSVDFCCVFILKSVYLQAENILKSVVLWLHYTEK